MSASPNTPDTAADPPAAAGPVVNGRVIGLAHYAGRAVAESVLAGYGAGFQESVTLRLTAVADGAVERDSLVAEVVDTLKTAEADAVATVDALIGKGLIATEGTRVRITDAGRKLYADTSAETGVISARIYAGIPAADLATAGRVLALVTERANAELAARKGA
ncbi:MarR family transcriptional regulator [Streptomyces sp. NPDC088789]|uniref:MarR family transcriptional regulator n=1 Tax=Streptomyces sp. NPDC088789 TaxID=3365899 RepID=UPI00382ABDB3